MILRVEYVLTVWRGKVVWWCSMPRLCISKSPGRAWHANLKLFSSISFPEEDFSWQTLLMGSTETLAAASPTMYSSPQESQSVNLSPLLLSHQQWMDAAVLLLLIVVAPQPQVFLCWTDGWIDRRTLYGYDIHPFVFWIGRSLIDFTLSALPLLYIWTTRMLS